MRKRRERVRQCVGRKCQASALTRHWLSRFLHPGRRSSLVAAQSRVTWPNPVLLALCKHYRCPECELQRPMAPAKIGAHDDHFAMIGPSFAAARMSLQKRTTQFGNSKMSLSRQRSHGTSRPRAWRPKSTTRSGHNASEKSFRFYPVKRFAFATK